MKRVSWAAYFSFLCFVFQCSAQGNATRVSDILAIEAHEVEALEVSTHPFVQQWAFGFGKSSLEVEDTQGLAGSLIERVDFYYSSYRESNSFAQGALNKRRLEAVRAVLPQAFTNQMTEWRMMVQIEDDNKEKAKELFHGVLVYYRPRPSATTMATELAFLHELLNKGAEAEHFEDVPITQSVSLSEVRALTEKTKVAYHSYTLCGKRYREAGKKLPSFPDDCLGLKRHIAGAYQSIKLRRRKTSAFFECKLNAKGEVSDFNFRHHGGVGRAAQAMTDVQEMPLWNMPKGGEDSMYTLKVGFTLARNGKKIKVKINYAELAKASKMVETAGAAVASVVVLPAVHFVDQTITKFFERHKDLRHAAVICDVTGSMSPYLGQVLLWHKLNFAAYQDQLQYFCFFNDGNNMRDRKKRVGEVGGLYFSEPKTYDEVQQLAFKAMGAGYGGDAPENNYEAALKTIKRYPSCEQLVMIADNWATPRDIELIDQIDQPIKVILCGVISGYINTAYLNAVRRNGGSIHTMESDIDTLSLLGEGETITIDGIDYVLKEGGFHKL